MEIRRACNLCGERWDGGLHDDACPKCQAVKSVVLSTDESYDPPEGYCYPEDDEDLYKDN
jgi:hypothetical protein